MAEIKLPPQGPECSDEARDILRKAPLDDKPNLIMEKSEVKTATEKLAMATERLNAWLAAAAATGNKLDPTMQREFINTAMAVGQAKRDLDAKIKKLNETVAFLTDVTKLHWPNTGDTLVSADIELSDKKKKDWLRDNQMLGLEVVRFVLQPSTPPKVPVSYDGGLPTDGIRYRAPVKGQLISCIVVPKTVDDNSGVDDITDPCAHATTMSIVDEGPIPQFGSIHILPYRNTPFQSNKIAATFREDGSLVTGSYTDLQSAGANAANTLSSLSELAMKTSTQFSQRETSVLTAKTKAVQAEAALLKAQADLENARLALQPSPTAAQNQQRELLQADVDLLNAERAKIEAELALREAREKAAVDSTK